MAFWWECDRVGNFASRSVNFQVINYESTQEGGDVSGLKKNVRKFFKNWDNFEITFGDVYPNLRNVLLNLPKIFSRYLQGLPH